MKQQQCVLCRCSIDPLYVHYLVWRDHTLPVHEYCANVEAGVSTGDTRVTASIIKARDMFEDALKVMKQCL